MTPPRVSFVMPVRNEARYLPAAIRSITRQSVTSWEMVVIDDGSTDDTTAILADAAATDPRIRVVTNRGRGLVDALNQGIALSTAPLIARMDGDDISHPLRLHHQLTFLDAHPEVGLVATSFRHFPRRHLRIGMLAYETWQNSLVIHERIMNDRFVESPFVHPTVVMRRDLVEMVGGYRDRGWPEDYDLWLTMADAGVRFHSLPQVLFYWRDHPERSTRTMDEYAAAAFRRCKISHLKNGFLRGVKELSLIGAGKEGRAWQRELAAVGIGVRSWVDLDPRKVGKILHGAPVRHALEIGGIPPPFLVTIGIRGARDEVRTWLRDVGLREGIDVVCVT
ncbi:MAG: glycosyltransferase [Desulfuromonadia bacterium]